MGEFRQDLLNSGFSAIGPDSERVLLFVCLLFLFDCFVFIEESSSRDHDDLRPGREEKGGRSHRSVRSNLMVKTEA